MKDIRIDTAVMIGFIVSVFLFGIYTAVFFATMYTLRSNSRRQRKSKFVTISLIVLYLLSILVMIMFCIDLYRGFITKREIPGTIIYFYTPTAVVRVVASFAYYILSLISDLIIIWRVWVIWQYDLRICAVPILLFVASMVCGGIMQDNLIKSLTRLHYLDLLYWTQIWWACNVTTGLLCTGLIVGRLWWMTRRFTTASSATKTVVDRVMLSLIESAAVYSVLMITELAFQRAKMIGNAQLMLYILPFISALTPTIIVLRLQSDGSSSRSGANNASHSLSLPYQSTSSAQQNNSNNNNDHHHHHNRPTTNASFRFAVGSVQLAPPPPPPGTTTSISGNNTGATKSLSGTTTRRTKSITRVVVASDDHDHNRLGVPPPTPSSSSSSSGTSASELEEEGMRMHMDVAEYGIDDEEEDEEAGGRRLDEESPGMSYEELEAVKMSWRGGRAL